MRAARFSTGSHPIPNNTVGNPLVAGGSSTVGSTVQSRQASPPLPAGLKQTSSVTGPTAQQSALLAGTVSPTAAPPPTSTAPPVSNAIPALLSRLLASTATNLDWTAPVVPVESSKTNPIQSTAAAPALPKTGQVPSVQSLATGNGAPVSSDAPSLGHTTLGSTTGAVPQIPPQLVQPPGLQPKRGSQPSESYSLNQPSGTGLPPTHSSMIPELANLLRSTQKYPDTGISREAVSLL